MQVLSEHELEGVIAHELAHVKHRDILISSIAATIAAAIMMRRRAWRCTPACSAAARDDRDEGANPIALLAMMIVAPLAAMLIQAAISRSREFAADAGGAAIAGTPLWLADALRKIDAASKRVPLDANPATAHMFIVKPFLGGGLMSLFSTHPPTEARIQALMGVRALSLSRMARPARTPAASRGAGAVSTGSSISTSSTGSRGSLGSRARRRRDAGAGR